MITGEYLYAENGRFIERNDSDDEPNKYYCTSLMHIYLFSIPTHSNLQLKMLILNECNTLFCFVTILSSYDNTFEPFYICLDCDGRCDVTDYQNGYRSWRHG